MFLCSVGTVPVSFCAGLKNGKAPEQTWALRCRTGYIFGRREKTGFEDGAEDVIEYTAVWVWKLS